MPEPQNFDQIFFQLMVPLLKFYFHDNVRCSAAQCIAPLVNCTLEAKGEQAAIELWKFSIKEVYQALETEPELEIIVSFSSSKSYFSKISRFLEQIPVEHIELIFSSESKLFSTLYVRLEFVLEIEITLINR